MEDFTSRSQETEVQIPQQPLAFTSHLTDHMGNLLYLKTLKRNLPTGLSPQLLCVTSVITEGSWSTSLGVRRKRRFAASSDWSMKDFT